VGAKGVKSTGKCRIFLIDDHPIVREGFAQLINQQKDLQVCGQSSTGLEAMAEIPAARPDLVILDLALRGPDGIDVVKNLRSLRKDMCVLVLSMHDEMLYAERALRAGANGYVMKQAPVAEIMIAIRKALNGKRYLSTRMQEVLVERAATGGSENGDDASRLSDRELEVFQLIGAGRGTREIAQQLKLSIKTIETYRANIKQKLKLRSGIDLVRAAVEMTVRH
jgi:DNA-binding NarL/FixJ family response regulator